MGSLDIRSLYSPGREFQRFIASISQNKDKIPRLIYKGVVTYVDRIGTSNRPQFGIKARIDGANSFDTKVEEDPFFPSLFAPNIISLPEIGEEVYIICEQEGNLSTGHWISKVAKQNTLIKDEVGKNSQSETVEGKRGVKTDQPIREDQDESPDNTSSVPVSRFKPGDTGFQGRSNAFVRATFDLKNKKGIIETATGEKSTESFYENEYRAIDGSRVVCSTLSDLDTLIAETLYDLQFHPKFTNGGGIKNEASAYLLLEALEVRILSRKGGNIQHVVLGEQQEEWLLELIGILKSMVTDLASHTHTSTATGTPTTPPIPVILATTATQLDDLKPKIKLHRSKRIAAN